jgi:NADH dehydrogenase (ubiquinone) flavoprotein 2
VRTTLQAAGESFEFSAANQKKLKTILAQYPKGKQASAVLPFLELAQRQNENWVSKEIVEKVAELLDMPVIKVFEVASFYSMFNLEPVGKFFVQVCHSTPCWLRGSDGVLEACRAVAAEESKGLISVVEVECMGACVNAPMMAVNEDYFEDLDAQKARDILTRVKAGKKVSTGSQIGRMASAPLKES